MLEAKCDLLRSLHLPGTPLVLPNAWDVPSARAVVAAGFPVVATSSGAVAEALGYEDHEADLADEKAGLDSTLRLARRECGQGETAEAARVVEAAARHAARHVPALRERLTLWRDAARVLSSVYPVPRLRVLAFRMWKLRGAAAGEGLARPVLDAANRFTLRVVVLLYALRVVLAGFRGAVERVESDPHELQRCLERLEALGSDLGTLHRASLEVYKALLISLHARAASARDD